MKSSSGLRLKELCGRIGIRAILVASKSNFVCMERLQLQATLGVTLVRPLLEQLGLFRIRLRRGQDKIYLNNFVR